MTRSKASAHHPQHRTMPAPSPTGPSAPAPSVPPTRSTRSAAVAFVTNRSSRASLPAASSAPSANAGSAAASNNASSVHATPRAHGATRRATRASATAAIPTRTTVPEPDPSLVSAQQQQRSMRSKRTSIGVSAAAKNSNNTKPKAGTGTATNNNAKAANQKYSKTNINSNHNNDTLHIPPPGPPVTSGPRRRHSEGMRVTSTGRAISKSRPSQQRQNQQRLSSAVAASNKRVTKTVQVDVDMDVESAAGALQIDDADNDEIVLDSSSHAPPLQRRTQHRQQASPPPPRLRNNRVSVKNRTSLKAKGSVQQQTQGKTKSSVDEVLSRRSRRLSGSNSGGAGSGTAVAVLESASSPPVTTATTAAPHAAPTPPTNKTASRTITPRVASLQNVSRNYNTNNSKSSKSNSNSNNNSRRAETDKASPPSSALVRASPPPSTRLPRAASVHAKSKLAKSNGAAVAVGNGGASGVGSGGGVVGTDGTGGPMVKCMRCDTLSDSSQMAKCRACNLFCRVSCLTITNDSPHMSLRSRPRQVWICSFCHDTAIRHSIRLRCLPDLRKPGNCAECHKRYGGVGTDDGGVVIPGGRGPLSSPISTSPAKAGSGALCTCSKCGLFFHLSCMRIFYKQSMTALMAETWTCRMCIAAPTLDGGIVVQICKKRALEFSEKLGREQEQKQQRQEQEKQLQHLHIGPPQTQGQGQPPPLKRAKKGDVDRHRQANHHPAPASTSRSTTTVPVALPKKTTGNAITGRTRLHVASQNSSNSKNAPSQSNNSNSTVTAPIDGKASRGGKTGKAGKGAGQSTPTAAAVAGGNSPITRVAATMAASDGGLKTSVPGRQHAPPTRQKSAATAAAAPVIMERERPTSTANASASTRRHPLTASVQQKSPPKETVKNEAKTRSQAAGTNTKSSAITKQQHSSPEKRAVREPRSRKKERPTRRAAMDIGLLNASASAATTATPTGVRKPSTPPCKAKSISKTKSKAKSQPSPPKPVSTKGDFTGAIEIVDLDGDDDDDDNNVTPAAATAAAVDDDDDDVEPVIRRSSRLSTGGSKSFTPTPSFSAMQDGRDTDDKDKIIVDDDDETTRDAPVRDPNSVVGGPSLRTLRARTRGSGGPVGVAQGQRGGKPAVAATTGLRAEVQRAKRSETRTQPARVQRETRRSSKGKGKEMVVEKTTLPPQQKGTATSKPSNVVPSVHKNIQSPATAASAAGKSKTETDAPAISAMAKQAQSLSRAAKEESEKDKAVAGAKNKFSTGDGADAKKALSKADDVKTDAVNRDTDTVNVVAHAVTVKPKDTAAAAAAAAAAVAAVNVKDQATAEAQRSSTGADNKLKASKAVDVASPIKPKADMAVEKKTADSVGSKVGAHKKDARKKHGPADDTPQKQTEAKENRSEHAQDIVEKLAGVDSERDGLAAAAIDGTGTDNADDDAETVEDESMAAQDREKLNDIVLVESTDVADGEGKEKSPGDVVDGDNGMDVDSAAKDDVAKAGNAQKQSKKQTLEIVDLDADDDVAIDVDMDTSSDEGKKEAKRKNFAATPGKESEVDASEKAASGDKECDSDAKKPIPGAAGDAAQSNSASISVGEAGSGSDLAEEDQKYAKCGVLEKEKEIEGGATKSGTVADHCPASTADVEKSKTGTTTSGDVASTEKTVAEPAADAGKRSTEEELLTNKADEKAAKEITDGTMAMDVDEPVLIAAADKDDDSGPASVVKVIPSQSLGNEKEDPATINSKKGTQLSVASDDSASGKEKDSQSDAEAGKESTVPLSVRHDSTEGKGKDTVLEPFSVSEGMTDKETASTKIGSTVADDKDRTASRADVDMNDATHSDVGQTINVDGDGADVDVAYTITGDGNKDTESNDEDVDKDASASGLVSVADKTMEAEHPAAASAEDVIQLIESQEAAGQQSLHANPIIVDDSDAMGAAVMIDEDGDLFVGAIVDDDDDDVELALKRAEAEAEGEVEPEADAEAEGEVEPDAEAEGEAESEREAEVEAELQAEPDAHLEAEAQADPDAEAEPKPQADPDAQADPETDMEVESGAIAEREGDVERELNAEREAELESEVISEPEAGVEREAEADSEMEGVSGTVLVSEADANHEVHGDPKAKAGRKGGADPEAKPQNQSGMEPEAEDKPKASAGDKDEADVDVDAEVEADAADELEAEREADVEPEAMTEGGAESDAVVETVSAREGATDAIAKSSTNEDAVVDVDDEMDMDGDADEAAPIAEVTADVNDSSISKEDGVVDVDIDADADEAASVAEGTACAKDSSNAEEVAVVDVDIDMDANADGSGPVSEGTADANDGSGAKENAFVNVDREMDTDAEKPTSAEAEVEADSVADATAHTKASYNANEDAVVNMDAEMDADADGSVKPDAETRTAEESDRKDRSPTNEDGEQEKEKCPGNSTATPDPSSLEFALDETKNEEASPKSNEPPDAAADASTPGATEPAADLEMDKADVTVDENTNDGEASNERRNNEASPNSDESANATAAVAEATATEPAVEWEKEKASVTVDERSNDEASMEATEMGDAEAATGMDGRTAVIVDSKNEESVNKEAEKDGTVDKDGKVDEAKTVAGVEGDGEKRVDGSDVGERIAGEGDGHDVQDNKDVVADIRELVDVEAGGKAGANADADADSSVDVQGEGDADADDDGGVAAEGMDNSPDDGSLDGMNRIQEVIQQEDDNEEQSNESGAIDEYHAGNEKEEKDVSTDKEDDSGKDMNSELDKDLSTEKNNRTDTDKALTDKDLSVSKGSSLETNKDVPPEDEMGKDLSVENVDSGSENKSGETDKIAGEKDLDKDGNSEQKHDEGVASGVVQAADAGAMLFGDGAAVSKAKDGGGNVFDSVSSRAVDSNNDGDGESDDRQDDPMDIDTFP